jgi:hypothetical protein
MRHFTAGLIITGAALAVALIVPVNGAKAQSGPQCRAECNARFNPADVPKEERWTVDSRRRACIARCGR